jgi:hypothetical protein
MKQSTGAAYYQNMLQTKVAAFLTKTKPINIDLSLDVVPAAQVDSVNASFASK